MSTSPGDVMKEANRNPDVPKIYANGFACSLGAGDIGILLQRADQPVALINMSYTTAKTLVLKLTGLIKFLEEKSGKSIMTTDDINQYFTAEEKDEADK
jgi:hypothetical protein